MIKFSFRRKPEQSSKRQSSSSMTTAASSYNFRPPRSGYFNVLVGDEPEQENDDDNDDGRECSGACPLSSPQRVTHDVPYCCTTTSKTCSATTTKNDHSVPTTTTTNGKSDDSDCTLARVLPCLMQRKQQRMRVFCRRWPSTGRGTPAVNSNNGRPNIGTSKSTREIFEESRRDREESITRGLGILQVMEDQAKSSLQQTRGPHLARSSFLSSLETSNRDFQ